MWKQTNYAVIHVSIHRKQKTVNHNQFSLTFSIIPKAQMDLIKMMIPVLPYIHSLYAMRQYGTHSLLSTDLHVLDFDNPVKEECSE